MAAPLLLAGASSVAQGASEDPLGWMIGFLIKVGSILLGSGLVLSYVAYLLNVYAAKTLGDIGGEAAAIWGVFGNVTYDPSNQPLLSITTSSPVSDIQNAGADIYRGLDNAWNDMSSAMGAIAQTLADIPPALLAIATHGPKILWDGLVGLVGEGLGDLLTFIFPWIIVTGILMIVLGLTLKAARWAWGVFVKPDMDLLLSDYLTLWTLPLKQRVKGLHDQLQARIGAKEGREAQAGACTARPEPPEASEPLPTPPDAPDSPESIPTDPRDPEEVLGESMPAPSVADAADRMRLAMRA